MDMNFTKHFFTAFKQVVRSLVSCLADPELGSGAFLTLQTGIRIKFSQILEIFQH
jgi:hypothetical protein